MSCIWPPAGSPWCATAVEVIDPFHVVHLAAGRLTMVRCRLQREATGRRGVKGERLYDCRRALLKTASLRTPRQRERVDTLLADPVNDALRLAHGVYQRIIACYRHKDPRLGRRMMGALIDALAEPTATRRCPELRSLGRTLKRRRADILAYFTHQHSSNGPTEAINGRLETLRGIAMGFDNFEHYRTLKRRRADILAYFTHQHSSNGPTEAINGRLETLRGIAMGFDNFEHYRQRSLIHSGNRSHQRPPRDPARHRHGIRQLRTLPPTKPHPLRKNQRHPYTLKREEPEYKHVWNTHLEQRY